MSSSDREAALAAALARLVRQAFRPPPTRHRRASFGAGQCDVTCQPCALAAGLAALEAWEASRPRPATD